VLVVLELVLVVLELVLVVLVDELEDVELEVEDDVLVVEVDVEVKSIPLQFAPSYLIQQSVSVSCHSSPATGEEGALADSYTFPISLENVVVILILL